MTKAALHAEALKAFDDIQSAMRDERLQCLQDRRFYSIAGAQWEGPLGEQFESKPRFEVNKVHLAVIRIINEYRNNRIAVTFVPKDGTRNDANADFCNGLFRADEYDSCAEEAYDNAFEESVGGGFGAMRLRTVYEHEDDPDDERQRIVIEPIYDADSCVFFDLDAKRQDKSDAKHCFVLYSMTREAFIDQWNQDLADWPKSIHQNEFDWLTPDSVYVAEWYRSEPVAEWILTFTGATGDEIKISLSDLEDDPAKLKDLEASGYRETARRKISKNRIHKYILSGNAILEDCGFIAGRNIPIVPTYGKRWVVDGVERCMGHVRLAKDAQRLKNMQLSKLGELSALSSVEKPILLPEQVTGHQMMWAEDNIKNYPYLLLNPVTGADGNPMPAGPVAYTKPPAVPQALAALLQLTDSDVQSILGNQQEGDKMVSNISGKAIEMIQTRMDMQTFIYMSNFAKAVRRAGEVWLSMAKDVYTEPGRKMKLIGSADDPSSAVLGIPGKDPTSGALTTVNDLSAADFDVSVTVGPSSTSRREATVRSLTNMLQVAADPETQQVLQAMAIMNMEGEGISDVREYFRKKLVSMGALKPNEEEAQAMAASAGKKTAQDQALEAMAEEAQAKAVQARASVLKTVADVELTKAKTIETLAGVDMQSTEQALQLASIVDKSTTVGR